MRTHVARWLGTATSCLVLALVLTPAAQAQTPLVQTASNPKLGTILVNAQGMTLYYLTSEAGGKFACNGQCLSFWPPLLLPAGTTAPTAASGVTGTLGVATRPDGSQQVTYNGFPLYTFANDKAPGDTNGNGIRAFGGGWFAATANSVQLAATVAERLTIGITSTAGTVWGKVVARYTFNQRQVVQVCSKRTCAFSVPHGVRVHLSQTPTDAMSWPFKNWEIKGLHATTRTQLLGNASISFTMKGSYRVNVVYTVTG